KPKIFSKRLKILIENRRRERIGSPWRRTLRLLTMDEVLGFRETHRKELRTYIRYIRKLARDLSKLPEEEREEVLKDRREELQQLSNKFKTASRKEWKRPASF